VTALMAAMCSVAFAAPAAVNLPRQLPPVTSVLAVAALGIINTGLAYWLFYLLIDEAGAATASVITYVMPVVTLFLGVGLLGEQLTIGAIAGLILIALGACLATSSRQGRTRADGSRTTAIPAQRRHSRVTTSQPSAEGSPRSSTPWPSPRTPRSPPRAASTSAGSDQQAAAGRGESAPGNQPARRPPTSTALSLHRRMDRRV
jgi:uncharacterized membrane protein